MSSTNAAGKTGCPHPNKSGWTLSLHYMQILTQNRSKLNYNSSDCNILIRKHMSTFSQYAIWQWLLRSDTKSISHNKRKK